MEKIYISIYILTFIAMSIFLYYSGEKRELRMSLQGAGLFSFMMGTIINGIIMALTMNPQ